MPLGSTATKVWAAKRWSSAKARCAAFWPAASPSNVNTTSPVKTPSSMRSRRSTLMWSAPKAVPQVATAVSTPARCAAMTSV